MNAIKTIFREIIGLFVDDGSFALAILLWLVLVRVFANHIGISPTWTGVILFAGLALILAWSTVRFSSRPLLGK